MAVLAADAAYPFCHLQNCVCPDLVRDARLSAAREEGGPGSSSKRGVPAPQLSRQSPASSEIEQFAAQFRPLAFPILYRTHKPACDGTVVMAAVSGIQSARE